MKDRQMDPAVRALFERYERLFQQALTGHVDLDALASLYATDVIGATPAGVMSGKNDDAFRQVMAQGYTHYRSIGTREMRIRNLQVSPIDACHCVAHVGWAATYARDDLPETVIDFDVHYLVQVRDGVAKVFGWVSGDEEAVLKQHGVI